ncbi:MAG: hypothetical protein WAW37_00145 [Syntrophobacteraceae bacterium]
MKTIYKAIIVLAVFGLLLPAVAMAAQSTCPVCPENGKVYVDRDRDALVCSWSEDVLRNKLVRGRAGQFDYVVQSVPQRHVQTCAEAEMSGGR